MDWFKKIFNKQTQRTVPEIVNKAWRTGMWVMTDRGVGILTTIGVTSIVDLTDVNGVTKEQYSIPLSILRQASWFEIPEKRRIGMTAAEGKDLGYGS